MTEPPNYKPAVECCGTCKYGDGVPINGVTWCSKHPDEGWNGSNRPALWRCDDYEPEGKQ